MTDQRLETMKGLLARILEAKTCLFDNMDVIMSATVKIGVALSQMENHPLRQSIEDAAVEIAAVCARVTKTMTEEKVE